MFGAVGAAPPPPPPPNPPAAPTGLTANGASASTVNLAWTDASGNETGFTLDRCQGTGCTTYATIATLPPGTTSFTDTGLAAATTYVYRVRAFNGDGPSAWSGTASARTLSVLTAPSAPTGLSFTAASRQITLRWTDTSGNETGFRVLRCTGTKCTPTNVVATLGVGATALVDTGLTPRTTYRYRVQSYNAAGTGTSVILTAKTTR